jgi:predicted SnoaL-like aldol condensation-catalyzing enzyme
MPHPRFTLSLASLMLWLASPLAIAQAGPAGTGAAPASASVTESNRRIVEDFVRLFYVQRDVRRAFETHISASGYIQHNPGMPDGRDAAIELLEPKFKNSAASFEPLRVIVDGNLAVVHLRVRPSPQGKLAAVADMFRLENGKIVEHWDVIQVMPDNPVSKHPLF